MPVLFSVLAYLKGLVSKDSKAAAALLSIYMLLFSVCLHLHYKYHREVVCMRNELLM